MRETLHEKSMQTETGSVFSLLFTLFQIRRQFARSQKTVLKTRNINSTAAHGKLIS